MDLIVRIRVRPASRRPGVGGNIADRLIVAVAQPALDGRANVAALKTLAEALGVKQQNLKLIRGATNRDKDFLLSNLTVAEISEIQARIEQLSA